MRISPAHYAFALVVFYFTLCQEPAKSVEERKTVEVVSIYDGDTFRCNIADWPDIIGHRIPIRIAGIDAPEMSGPDKESGRISKQFVVEKLRAAKKVEISGWQRDKYFRILATVYVDGENLGDMLLKAKLAKEWTNKQEP